MGGEGWLKRRRPVARNLLMLARSEIAKKTILPARLLVKGPLRRWILGILQAQGGNHRNISAKFIGERCSAIEQRQLRSNGVALSAVGQTLVVFLLAVQNQRTRRLA